MKLFRTPEPGYGCDKCGKRFHEGTELLGCRACNYDLCLSCSRDEIIRKSSRLGHFKSTGQESAHGFAGAVDASLKKNGNHHIGNMKLGCRFGETDTAVGAMVTQQANVYKYDNGSVSANIGLSVSTGAEISHDKLEAKFLGVGGNIGSDGIGLSTPFGGINLKFPKFQNPMMRY